MKDLSVAKPEEALPHDGFEFGVRGPVPFHRASHDANESPAFRCLTEHLALVRSRMNIEQKSLPGESASSVV